MSTLHFPTDHGPTFSFDINTDFEWTKGEDGRLIGRIQRSERALKIIKCLYDMMKSGKHLVNSGILGMANIEKIGPWEGVKRGEGYCEIVIRKRVEKTHAKVHFPFDTEPHQLASQEFHQKRFQTVLDGLSKITAFTLHDSGALDVNVQLLVETVYNMTSVIGCRCAILPHDAREGGKVKALVYAPGHGEFQVTAKV